MGTKSQKIEYFDGLEVDVRNANGTYKYHFNNAQRECTYSPDTPGPRQFLTEQPFEPTTFLPDLSQYTSAGFENIGGIRCQKFVLDVPHGDTGVMDDHVAFYWDPVLAKPVRWRMHSRHLVFDSHTDEYVMDYLSWQPTAPKASEFELPELCKTPVIGEVSNRIGAFLKSVHGAAAKIDAAQGPGKFLFDAYLQHHGKEYVPDEYAKRKAIFLKNVNFVTELNQQHAGVATFRGNQFLDMTKKEVLSFRGGKTKGTRAQRLSPEHLKYTRTHKPALREAVLPKSFDWRMAKPEFVSRVKDQAVCGSCWTYGAIGPIETMQAIKTGHLVELPEQFLVDCAWKNATGSSGGNFGCDGGNADLGALEIIRKYGGVIPTAKDYGSYLSVNGYCKDIQQMEVGAKISGWNYVKERDEQGLLSALVAKGPISVNIMVPDEMLYFDKGILNVSSCKANADEIDHAVVLVGYGIDAESGLEYYTIRNSWSTYWGDEGYIKVARGDFDCATASDAGYPEMVSSVEDTHFAQQKAKTFII